jgi:hypothetical protein
MAQCNGDSFDCATNAEKQIRLHYFVAMLKKCRTLPMCIVSSKEKKNFLFGM